MKILFLMEFIMKKSKIFKLNVFLILFITLLSSCSKSSKKDSNFLEEKIITYIDSIFALNNYNTPAMIVKMKDSNKKIDLLYSKGYSNLETQTLFNQNQIFAIGSNTKTFTVMTFLELIQEEKLDPETYLSDYFPDIEQANAIKLKYLANMTSGIPNYTDNELFWMEYLLANFGNILDFSQILDYISHENHLFTPGSQFTYSNSNTRILSEIIEQVTGNTIKQEIENRFITKLGLNNTHYPQSVGMPTNNFVHGYDDLDDDGVPEDLSGVYHPSIFGSAGCMFSTINDMEKWVKYLANGCNLSAEMMYFRQEGTYNESDFLKYKMGFVEVNGWIGHTGGVLGYSTLMMHNPELNNTIILIQNSLVEAYPNWQFFQEIINLIY